MSRSYKKHPWIKDSSEFMRRVHHGRMRAMQRNILREYLKQVSGEYAFYVCWTIDHPEFKHYREVSNQYDIMDWKFYGEELYHRRK